MEQSIRGFGTSLFERLLGGIAKSSIRSADVYRYKFPLLIFLERCLISLIVNLLSERSYRTGAWELAIRGHATIFSSGFQMYHITKDRVCEVYPVGTGSP
jgi:hypothetical protein